jgi:hypothetical protein
MPDRNPTGVKKNFCHTFFLSPQISQNCKLFYFWNAEEKNVGQFSKNYRTFLPKNLSLSSQKYGFGIWDPRSGIPKKTYSDSWIRVQGSKKHRIRNTETRYDKKNFPPSSFLFLLDSGSEIRDGSKSGSEKNISDPQNCLKVELQNCQMTCK